jgi:DNA processing protein
MNDLPQRLALLRAPEIGPVRYTELVARCGGAAQVLEQAPSQAHLWGLPRATIDYLCAPDWSAVEHDLAWLGGADNHVLGLDSADYPPLLRETHAPPPLLFVRGDPRVLHGLQLAVVGSRNPTASGGEIAATLSGGLAGAGLTVTSGMALGIDAAAHRGALRGGGPTIAVTGTGLDRVYPASHRGLAHEIAGHGALVSELPPGTGPRAEHFPRRNRIIAGLSLGTLVVEAALRSGSLITARHAMEQGREVFAVPGSIRNPLARGCHRLIREGAKLVEDVADILEELAPLAGAAGDLEDDRSIRANAGSGDGASSPRPRGRRVSDVTPSPCLGRNYNQEEVALSGAEGQLLDALGFDPVGVDTIVQRSGLTAEAVSSMLLVLELHGHVVSTAGGLYTRVGKGV